MVMTAGQLGYNKVVEAYSNGTLDMTNMSNVRDLFIECLHKGISPEALKSGGIYTRAMDEPERELVNCIVEVIGDLTRVTS